MKPPPERLSRHQRALVTTALEDLDCAVIYLFGSFGGPAEHPQSDIDIAFLPSSPVDPLDCFGIANALADQLGRSVDLIDLKRSSTVLAKEVLRTGTPLLVTDPACQQDFEMRVLADYARLNEERQPVLAV